MTKLFCLILMIIPATLWAQSKEIQADVSDGRKINHRAHHWVSTFGFEGMAYDVPYNFSGARHNYHDEKKNLFGGRLGFGGQLYLGKGFVTTTMLEGYYLGTLFTKKENAGPSDTTLTAANSKTTGQIMGLDVTQKFGFLFDMKTKNPFLETWTYLTVEPFIEVGVGYAQALNKLKYHYDTGTSGSGVQEDYKFRQQDTLVNAKIGAGFNLTSNQGFFLYVKGTLNNYQATTRKTSSNSKPDNGTWGISNHSKESNVHLDPIVIYAIGGGYKF